MKRLDLFFVYVVLSILLTGCIKEEVDKEKVVEMTIYPETGYGASVLSNVWTQPLIYSIDNERDKGLLMDIIIEGFNFDYERGYEYKLKVKKVWMHNPPQDVSSIKYVFIKLLSKKKVITHDSEEEIDLLVASKTVKFTPTYPFEYKKDGSRKIYDALKARTKQANDPILLTNIEGFNYEPGYEYELKVKKSVTADPYAVKYVLIDILSKTKK